MKRFTGRGHPRFAASTLVACAPLALAAHAGATAPLAYSTTRAPQIRLATFGVGYSGSGTWRTDYHSTPPSDPTKPQGAHDTNDAHDSSTQKWSLTFASQLQIPTCGPQPNGRTDPCQRLGALSRARGLVAATGRVDHRHADGLFPGQNSTVKCSVRAAPSAGVPLNSAIHLHYSKQARTIEVTALTPVAQALGSLPGACPGQGDSLDGLFDNYFTPGFSFSTHYGPERWFRSKTIEIPASVFHHSARIVIPLADTRASTPPHDCAVPSPAFQLCTTGGAWHGVLTFNRQPPRR